MVLRCFPPACRPEFGVIRQSDIPRTDRGRLGGRFSVSSVGTPGYPAGRHIGIVYIVYGVIDPCPIFRCKVFRKGGDVVKQTPGNLCFGFPQTLHDGLPGGQGVKDQRNGGSKDQEYRQQHQHRPQGEPVAEEPERALNDASGQGSSIAAASTDTAPEPRV